MSVHNFSKSNRNFSLYGIHIKATQTSSPQYSISSNKDFLYIDWMSIINCLICIIGVFTNIINIIVFMDKKLKDPSYKYMLLLAINNTIYLFMLVFIVFIKCGTVCDVQFAHFYSTNFYVFYFLDYFTSCLAINGILIELILSLQRLCLSFQAMKSRFLKLFHESFETFALVLFLFSFFYYAPILFLKKIVPFKTNNSSIVHYRLEETELGKSVYGKVVLITLSIIRLCLATVVLLAINLLTTCKFNRYMTKKTSIFNLKNTKHTSKINRKKYKVILSNKYNITLLVITRSFLFSLGTIPYMINYIICIMFKNKNNENYFAKVQTILLTCVHLMYSFDIFVYYFFNRIYRKTLRRIFGKYFKIFNK
jgi:hypothetical protein